MHLFASRTIGAPLAAAVLAAVAALAAAPPDAAAQPGAEPPPPGGYGPAPGYGPGYGPPPRYYDPVRRGLTLGVGVGLGFMDSDSNLTECFDCDYNPVAFAFDAHVGVMLSPRLAILGEVFWHAQTLDEDGFNWLSQTMLMGAAQLWLTPQLWIKGGLGVAALSSQYDDGYAYADDHIDGGFAVMGAAGFEILHSPWFAVDLQGRLASGSYEGVDEQVNVGTVGIGINWY